MPFRQALFRHPVFSSLRQHRRVRFFPFRRFGFSAMFGVLYQEILESGENREKRSSVPIGIPNGMKRCRLNIV